VERGIVKSRLPYWKSRAPHFSARPNAVLKIGGKKVKTSGKKVSLVRRQNFRTENSDKKQVSPGSTDET
jgi:hypothetical protein